MVVIPMLHAAIHAEAHGQQHGGVLDAGTQVLQLDDKRPALIGALALWLDILGHHLAHGLPVIDGEAHDDALVEGQVADEDVALQEGPGRAAEQGEGLEGDGPMVFVVVVVDMRAHVGGVEREVDQRGIGEVGGLGHGGERVGG